ncbi:MAG: 16S rRNA (adenine(1518)-N(6)/adenine(1519)-N(6))-dimethyltransferase RsmA [Candidatus Paceibacterota bacterium]|jgi:16S rRNA (adenine1518-N6/adenine1519-N6)-dimethyltransferase
MSLFAKKSLGQHFLKSTHVLEQIIHASEIKPGETILEIGPGTGVLTDALLSAGAKVVAVEKDQRALEVLHNKNAENISLGKTCFRLIDADILEVNPNDLGLEQYKYAIVANIPYYITGAILEKFLENEPRPSRMVLLVQREVAERILARPENGEKQGKESILSISIKAFGVPKIVAKVPPGAFVPPPTVDSAILAISDISDRRFTNKNVDIKHFFRIVRAGFAHKRKYLVRNLESVIKSEEILAIWRKNSLDTKVRAEDLPLDMWFSIASGQ